MKPTPTHPLQDQDPLLWGQTTDDSHHKRNIFSTTKSRKDRADHFMKRRLWNATLRSFQQKDISKSELEDDQLFFLGRYLRQGPEQETRMKNKNSQEICFSTEKKS